MRESSLAPSGRDNTDGAVLNSNRRDRREAWGALSEAFAFAAEREFRGWDYSDGMSSPVRAYLPGEHDWVNLAIQEIVKRAPVNLRPAFGIPRRRNFKGCGLFASGAVTAYELTGRESFLEAAERLVEWLDAAAREEPFGWGHNHELQVPARRISRNTPNIVSTTYIVRAMMALARHAPVPEYDRLPDRVDTLVREHLLDRPASGPRLRYDPGAPEGTYVLNANALGGALLVELAKEFDRPDLRELGEELLDYVVSCQHPLGGWEYMDPPEASHLSMDNHHTGFIVESLLRHRVCTGSDRYDEHFERGRAFYRDVLFDADGAPRWDERNRYPRDIHGAAQGIVTFGLADQPEFASRIVGWTLERMYRDGRFYYRKGRIHTRRFTLMRWGQAWMVYALSRYLGATAETSPRSLTYELQTVDAEAI